MKRKYWIFASATSFIWACGPILIRLTVGEFSATTLAAARIWIAALTMLAICLIKKKPPPKRRDVPVFIFAGAVGFALYTVFYALGFSMVTVTTGTVILSLSPIFTALLAQLFMKERIRPLGWVFTGVSFLGILILVLWNGALSVNNGVLILLLTAVLLSTYNFIQRKLTKSYDAIQSCAYSLIAAAIILSPFLPAAIGDLAKTSPVSFSAIIILGTCNSGLAYLCWSKAFSLADRTADVANFLYLPPFLATLIAFVAFHELPDLGTVVGGIVILFGLWMFQKKA